MRILIALTLLTDRAFQGCEWGDGCRHPLSAINCCTNVRTTFIPTQVTTHRNMDPVRQNLKLKMLRNDRRMYSAIFNNRTGEPGSGMGDQRQTEQDFPGSPVVKNPPASAEDIGSIPDPGRFHMLQGNPYTATTEPLCPRAHALQQEKPPQ